MTGKQLEQKLNELREAGVVIQLIPEKTICRLVVDEVELIWDEKNGWKKTLITDGEKIDITNTFLIKDLYLRGEYPQVTLIPTTKKQKTMKKKLTQQFIQPEQESVLARRNS